MDWASIALLLIFVALGYVRYRSIAARLTSVWQTLQWIETTIQADPAAALSLENLRTFEEELAQVEADLKGVRNELRPLLSLAPHLGWIPAVGGDLKAAPHLLDAAIDMVGAGRLAFEGAQPVAELLAGGLLDPLLGGGLNEVILSTLAAERLRFLEAQDRLSKAAVERREIDRVSLSPRLGRYVDRLDEYLPLFQVAAEAAVLAPDLVPGLLGLSAPRNYLILAQNNHELRATGGFISAVGLLHFDKSLISTTGFHDSYRFDEPAKPYSPPPETLAWYMWAGVWLLRDANWSPDFPTSARVAEDLYRLRQGVAVDGVLALDLTAVEDIVRAIGPLYLKAYSEIVSEENVIDKVKLYWSPPPGEEQDREWWSHRKDFLAALAEAVFAEMREGLDARQTVNLLRALGQSLEEKHLLIYLNDPAARRLLEDKNWDGAIRSTEGDYLLVVDTNVGFNKVDPHVERAIDYQVVIDQDGEAHGEVRITYWNESKKKVKECVQEARHEPTYDQMMEGCYWDYLRLYVPEGSLMTGATEIPLPEGSLPRRLGGAEADEGGPIVGPPEGGKEVLSHFFVVPPGQELEVRFAYDLPAWVFQKADGRYNLLVQKQPGTQAVPFRFSIIVPPGLTVVEAGPKPTWSGSAAVGYEVELSTDQRFELVLR